MMKTKGLFSFIDKDLKKLEKKAVSAEGF